MSVVRNAVRLTALLAFAALWFLPAEANSLPRYTLTAGSPCSTCHTTSQGGGMRSGIGWSTSKTNAALGWDDLGIKPLDEVSSNELVEGLSFGMDTRLQMARLGTPQVVVQDNGDTAVDVPNRRVIPMQLQPYLSYDAADWVDLEASWAAGPSTFSEGDFCSTAYAGQSCFTAQAIIHGDPKAPMMRAGMLQPSFGIRTDDHTSLVRHDAGRGDRTTLIPPNYAEPGAEMSWQPISWFQADAAGFMATNLAEAVGDPTVLGNTTAGGSARVRFAPRFPFDEINDFIGWMGASYLTAGEFSTINAFAGLGWLDHASLLVEGSRLEFGGDQNRIALNLSSKLSIPIKNWLVLNGQFGRALAQAPEEIAEVTQISGGIQFYPLPWIEIRPEYRYRLTNEWHMAQYTAQLHLFY